MGRKSILETYKIFESFSESGIIAADINIKNIDKLVITVELSNPIDTPSAQIFLSGKLSSEKGASDYGSNWIGLDLGAPVIIDAQTPTKLIMVDNPGFSDLQVSVSFSSGSADVVGYARGMVVGA